MTTDSLCSERYAPQRDVASTASAQAALGVLYLNSAEAERYLTANADHVLGVVCHGNEVTANATGLPVASVAMPQLDHEPLVEIWKASERVLRGSSGSLVWSRGGDLLFGLYRQPPHEDGLESGTYHAYQAIFSLLAEQQTPHLLRIWNYFSAINADDPDGMERYKHFCVGRYEAFAESARLNTSDIPAASAVGSHGGEFVLYFIAASRRGVAVENDRQVSAYNYPPQYGPRSPLFSRATQLDWLPRRPLFISGTASIIGHASIYYDDAAQQTREALNNIRRLLDLAYPGHALPFALVRTLKIYVRHEKDLPAIRSQIEAVTGKAIPSIYLLADICRSELLLEIEAIAEE
ncbi:MAG TPA: hypothetical protein VGE50_06050 [Gammaproteobacteria bacterium]